MSAFFQFRYYYPTETGFYYLQSRYYDPVTHRFINADSYTSTGQGMLGHNMFAYCRNNPVLRRDASGFSDKTDMDGDGDFYEIEAYGGGGGYYHGPTSPGYTTSSYTTSTPYYSTNSSSTSTSTSSNMSSGIGGSSGYGAGYGGSTVQANKSSLFNTTGKKNARYITKRGWTMRNIATAIRNGVVGRTVNRGNNNAPCSVYFYPGTNHYVVIENHSKNLVQLSEFGNAGWIPDKGIEFLNSEVLQ